MPRFAATATHHIFGAIGVIAQAAMCSHASACLVAPNLPKLYWMRFYRSYGQVPASSDGALNLHKISTAIGTHQATEGLLLGQAFGPGPLTSTSQWRRRRALKGQLARTYPRTSQQQFGLYRRRADGEQGSLSTN